MTSSVRKAAIAALSAILLAGTAFCSAAQPVVLTVDGMNFGTFGCDEGMFQGSYLPSALNPHAAACGLIGSLVGAAALPDNDPLYLNSNLEALCGGACGELTGFYWDGDIKKSRAAVEELKNSIISLGRYSAAKGEPFIIVAHSWGGVLAAEALAEISGWDLAPELKVDKVVTLGTPLGGRLYRAAVGGLINNQNFYAEPRRAPSVARWVNYWAPRDFFSDRLSFADENVQLDADPKFRDAEDKVRTQLIIYGPGPQLDLARADIDKLSAPLSTGLWHALYFNGGTIDLPSIGETLDTGMAGALRAELSGNR